MGGAGRVVIALVLVMSALVGLALATSAVHDTPTESAGSGASRSDAPVEVQAGPELRNALAATVEVDAFLGGSDAMTGAAVAIGPSEFLTAEHVVEGSREVDVLDADGRSLPVIVTRRDAERDLALLRTAAPHGLPVLQLRTDRAARGEDVWVIGGSDWLQPFTQGTVKGTLDACRNGVMTVRTTAVMNSGDSGGPMTDRAGRVIGINAFSMDGEDSYGIAVSEIMEFLAVDRSSLDAHGYVVRPENADEGECTFE